MVKVVQDQAAEEGVEDVAEWGERMEELVCRQCQEGVMRGHQDPAGVEGARIRCVN